MSSASFRVNLSALKKLGDMMQDQQLRQELYQLGNQKGVLALVAQAIADNFDQEGPGWAPLKAQTIRRSVAKKMRKELSKMTDKELLAYERKARLIGAEDVPNRRILQRTGLLRNVATKPGYSGSGKGGISGRNTITTSGPKLIWRVDLVYAGVHNSGDPKRHIPKREYMKLRAEWERRLLEYLVEQAFKIIWSRAQALKA